MKNINTYDYNMDVNALAKAAEYSTSLLNTAENYLEIFYDKADGSVWFEEFIGDGSWRTRYNKNAIIAFRTYKKMSAQQIADKIAARLADQ